MVVPIRSTVDLVLLAGHSQGGVASVPAVGILVLSVTHSAGIDLVGIGGLGRIIKVLNLDTVQFVGRPDLGQEGIILSLSITDLQRIVLSNIGDLGRTNWDLIQVDIPSEDKLVLDRGRFQVLDHDIVNSLVTSVDQGQGGAVAGFHLMAHRLVTSIRIPMDRSRRMKSCSCLRRSMSTGTVR